MENDLLERHVSKRWCIREANYSRVVYLRGELVESGVLERRICREWCFREANS